MEKSRKASDMQKGQIAPSCNICPTPRSEPIEGARPIDPQSIAAQFIDHCVSEGWIITRRTGSKKSYFLTEAGAKNLVKLGINP